MIDTVSMAINAYHAGTDVDIPIRMPARIAQLRFARVAIIAGVRRGPPRHLEDHVVVRVELRPIILDGGQIGRRWPVWPQGISDGLGVLEPAEGPQAGADRRRPLEILESHRFKPGLVVVMAGRFVTQQAIDLHFSGHAQAGRFRVLRIDLFRLTSATARQVMPEIHQELKITQPNVGGFESACPAPIGNWNLCVRRRISQNPRLTWPARLGAAFGPVKLPAPANRLIFMTAAARLL